MHRLRLLIFCLPIFYTPISLANWFDLYQCRKAFSLKSKSFTEESLLIRPENIESILTELGRARSALGQKYKMNSNIEIKYSYKQDQIRSTNGDGLTDINIYSKPYLDDTGEYVIDLNVTKTASGHYLNDQDFLHTIKLDDFYFKMKDSYFSSQVHIGSTGYFAPAKTAKGNKLVAAEVLEIEQDLIVLLIKNKIIRIKKEKFFFENYFIPKEDRKTFNKFFKAGGKGQVFSL